MTARKTVLVALGLVALAAVFAAGAFKLARRPASSSPALSVTRALGGPTEGFARAVAPRPFAFPDDHGPHPEFRTEWWYYTGNLQTAEGRHFGFQLTFFRIASAATMVTRTSAWASRDTYMAHFAVTDTAGRRFHAAGRLSRAALGLAGAQAEPFKVWLEDWSVEGVAGGAAPVRLRAAQDGAAIDVTLTSAKPVVLQGERGLDRKGAEPGNASYYYSLTRMPATGRVTVGGTAFDVNGLAWMDREWSTSSLGAGVVGWDWMALQLDDGRELMLYHLRRADGTADQFSGGSLVAADGTSRRLGLADFRIEARETWTSPRDGTRYPSRWRVTLPAEALELDIVPRLPDQELTLTVRYWEGAVRVEGRASGRPIAGIGYVELVGYARDAPTRGRTAPAVLPNGCRRDGRRLQRRQRDLPAPVGSSDEQPCAGGGLAGAMYTAMDVRSDGPQAGLHRASPRTDAQGPRQAARCDGGRADPAKPRADVGRSRPIASRPRRLAGVHAIRATTDANAGSPGTQDLDARRAL